MSTKTITTFTAGTALALVMFAGAAQADMAAMEKRAEEIQQAIALDPDLSQYRIDAVPDEEGVTLTGMIDDEEDFNALAEMVDGMEDADMIENEIVMQ